MSNTAYSKTVAVETDDGIKYEIIIEDAHEELDLKLSEYINAFDEDEVCVLPDDYYPKSQYGYDIVIRVEEPELERSVIDFLKELNGI